MSLARNLRRSLLLGTGLIGATAVPAHPALDSTLTAGEGAGLVDGAGLVATETRRRTEASEAQRDEAETGRSDARRTLDRVTVTGRRYGVERLDSHKYALPLLDTPRSVNVVDSDLLAEQGRRSLRDSLRNVTGISIQAGEGNPPGGTDAVTIRGFSARDDIFVDGMRDVGLYFRDPFGLDQIEVTKGPGSSVSGRGNVGGSVNLVSRKPGLGELLSFEGSVGTDEYFRGTVDYNTVLSQANGIALRINAMGHSAEVPDRDQVQNKRWAVAPSIAFGLGTRAEVTLSYFHQEQDDLPDGGIPNARNPSLAGSGFEGRPAPVPRDSFFGHTTDFSDVTVDRVTLRLDHDFSEHVALRSQFRYGRTHNDQIISSPRFVGSVTTLDETIRVVGNQKPRKQRDNIWIGQTDLLVDFQTADWNHNAVIGVEASSEGSRNRRRLDANGPPTGLFDPQPRPAAPIPFNGTVAKTDTDVLAFYVFDTIEITPRWLLSGGVRYDHVETSARGIDETGNFPGFVTDLERDDDEVSGNFGLTFKPTPDSSLYAAWGTSFETNARSEIVQLAGGNNNPPVTPANFNVDPERTRAFEVGGKWDTLEGALSLTAAAFQIKKVDARTPGSDPNDPPVVLEGEQRIRGFELGAVGALTDTWNVFAGYTFLDGEVTESNRAFEVGQRLPLTPENSFTLWTSWQPLPDLSVGGGVQYVDSRTSDIRSSPTANIVIRAGDYALLDLFAQYRFNRHLSVRVNLDNLTDTSYIEALTSGQSVPGPGRALRAAAIVEF